MEGVDRREPGARPRSKYKKGCILSDAPLNTSNGLKYRNTAKRLKAEGNNGRRRPTEGARRRRSAGFVGESGAGGALINQSSLLRTGAAAVATCGAFYCIAVASRKRKKKLEPAYVSPFRCTPLLAGGYTTRAVVSILTFSLPSVRTGRTYVNCERVARTPNGAPARGGGADPRPTSPRGHHATRCKYGPAVVSSAASTADREGSGYFPVER
ncbi:hypothetical protein EVAR_94281_1 [Eumeta japonica]|uniref:Uncharacterized protein n=1 Tax=Eumeta variegata TaxID=151549 RepID=A0A4C1UFU2_EUMVA|nr:hypothetical protein EVAR_94281_1 [Eumeta japonica]